MSLYSYPLIVENFQEVILEVIEKNRTVIIKGPTGCGKSTFIPYLLKDKRVAIIEPRRIAVMSLYNTLSSKITNLGYKMRFNKKLSPSTTMTIYTDGSFLNSINSLDYDYIIVDEVHERSLRTDTMLAILRLTYKNKLILMSATLDTTRIENFFKAVTFVIPGNGFPVEVKHLDQPTGDYTTECYFTIKNILKTRDQEESKDILVFLPGEEDINEVFKLCKKIPLISVCRVHSTMNDKDQMKIYEKSELTRVILSTNICETSLTIPNIKYVIDTGLYKNKVFNEISYLGIQSINRESAIQRMGRCNRFGPGVCHRLYTSSQELPKYMPEILRSDLTTVFLHLINLKRNILTLEFIDFPPIKNVILAIEFLISKACIQLFYKQQKVDSVEALEKLVPESPEYIDNSTVHRDLVFKITNYGRKLVYHPFDVHLSHFYEQCVAGGFGYYGSVVVSLISQENYNFLDGQFEKTPDIQYLIELFEKYHEEDLKLEFCQKKRIPIKGLEIATRISKTLDNTRTGGIDTVQRIFSKCFEHNLCTRQDDGSYLLHRINRPVFIHPTSGFFKRKDRKIVLEDVFCSTKVYARIIGRHYE